MTANRHRAERGSSILEFSLCLLVLAPALLGMFTVGMNLNRNLQVMQLGRDAGHMFVRGVDFSQDRNQRLLARLGRELKMVRSGTADEPDGNGGAVIILTKIHVPTLAECTAAGLTAPDCVNIGIPTIAQRVVIGNAGLFASSFGAPASGNFHSGGGCQNVDILVKPELQVTNLAGLPPIPGGQDAFTSEVYAASPDFDLAGAMTGTGVYARAIF